MVGILRILDQTPNRLELRLRSVDFRLALETVALTLFNAHDMRDRTILSDCNPELPLGLIILQFRICIEVREVLTEEPR
jgi:hypothetical protein